MRRLSTFGLATRPSTGAVLIGTAAVVMLAAAGFTLRRSTSRPVVVLARYRTSLAERTPNQAANIRVAAQRIDGTRVMPGAVFSFGAAVGPVSGETGFVKGLAIRGGEPASEDGGGICQVASTLYNAALRANLRIVERRKHLWPVKSVPPGLDATFASGSADLKFQNSLGQPLVIRLAAADRHLVALIVGERAESVEVEIVRSVLATLPAERIVRTSPLLRRGQQRVANRGRPGYEVEVHRHVRQGEAVTREKISRDRYAPVNEILYVGSR